MRKFFYLFACVTILLLCVVNFVQSFQKLAKLTCLEIPTKGTVLIDVGHGGEDGGTVGVNGILEKDINLQIALKLSDVLKQNGYQVIMTRDSDIDLGDNSLETVAKRKRSDLVKRAEIINSSKADLAISIHQNYFEQSKYSGAQCFYYDDNSKKLAETVQLNLVNSIDPQNNRVASFVEGKYILNNASIPIIIAECGFLSNEKEANLLSQEDYQTKIAKAIVQGINEYLNTYV